MIFTPQYRTHLRTELLDRAAADPRIEAAAITGSAASDNEDRWSDIDLAFSIRTPADLQPALADWTTFLYEQHGALHHLDVIAGPWIYRVFLLAGTLQLDLAFVPASDFRPLASTFRLIFGTAREPQALPAQSAETLIGYAWLYALHARTCIARGRQWQAEYMISGVRDNCFALACIRHKLPSVHGRGIDLLPEQLKARFEGALVRELSQPDLTRAFHSAIDALREEMRAIDSALFERLSPTLDLLKQ